MRGNGIMGGTQNNGSTGKVGSYVNSRYFDKEITTDGVITVRDRKKGQQYNTSVQKAAMHSL